MTTRHDDSVIYRYTIVTDMDIKRNLYTYLKKHKISYNVDGGIIDMEIPNEEHKKNILKITKKLWDYEY